MYQASAQHPLTDSLEKVLHGNNISDSMRIELCIQLSNEYTFSNSERAEALLKDAIGIAMRNGSANKVGEGYSNLGVIFFQFSKYDSAQYYYEIAESYFLKDTSVAAKENLMINRMSMGTLALQRGQHETAIKQYLTVIKELGGTGHKELITAYGNLGLVYHDLKEYEKAIDNYQAAIEECKLHPEEKGKKASVLIFLALDHLNLKNYDSASFYITLTEKHLSLMNVEYYYSVLYALKARYYNDIGQYRNAISFADKAIRSAETSENQFEKAQALLQKGIALINLKNYPASIPVMEEALTLFRAEQDPQRRSHALKYLSESYSQLGDYQNAYVYAQEYITLKDSINIDEAKKKITEIEMKYEAAKKETAIIELQKNNELQKASIQQKSTMNMALIGGCMFSVLVAGLLYRNYQNKNNLLWQKEALHQQQINEMKKERKIAVMESVLKGQEEERSRLAKDLHDGVGGLLSGVKLSISGMTGNVILSEENAMMFDKVIRQLDQSISELRRVSHNMMPEALLKFGLAETLRNYCDHINFTGKLHVRFQAIGLEGRMDQNSEIIIYRIFQELLNNVIKHANAQQVLVQLTQENSRFTLTVEDDGKGFDINGSFAGAGLSNIKSRAAYLNGTVDVVSKEGEGTSVHLEGDC